MEEVREKIIAKGILEDYLLTLNAVHAYMLSENPKLSQIIIERIEKTKENVEGRELVKRYFEYDISNEEL